MDKETWSAHASFKPGHISRVQKRTRLNQKKYLSEIEKPEYKKDGFSMAKEIRKNDSVTPIIFLTAKSMKEDTIEGFKIGGDDYITKPFDRDELRVRVDAVMRRIFLEKNPPDETLHFEIGE